MSGISKKMMVAASAGTGGGVVEANAIDFDGTNDYLSRSTDLVGNADGKTFTFSVFGYLADTPGGTRYIYANRIGSGGDSTFAVYYDNTNLNFKVFGKNAALSTVFLLEAPAGNFPSNTFLHFLVSIDLSNTGSRALYINDELQAPTWATYNNDSIDFTLPTHSIASINGGNKIKGRLSNIYLDYTYRDLSVEANRRLFIDEDGRPASGQAALNPILYLPMDDPDDPGRNDGTGGDFTLNGTIARSGRGPNQYNSPASTFDGSADYLSRVGLTGATDSKTFTFSFRIKRQTTSGAHIFHIPAAGAFRFFTQSLASGRLDFEGSNSAGTKILEAQCSGFGTVGKYFNVAISVDMANASNRHVYIDGSPATVSWLSYSDAAIDITATNYFVGALFGSSNFWDGEISDLWFDTTYIDLSANNPFWDSDLNKPKFLGETGELPTGTAPLIYLPLRADDAGANKGTGGDFSVNSGPFVGARGPSEFWASSAEFNGTNQHHKRTSALIGATDSAVFSIAFAMRADTTNNSELIFDIGTFTGDGLKITKDGPSLSLQGWDASGTIILDATTGNSGGVFSPDIWYTVLVSWDRSNTSRRNIYINGLNRSGFPLSANWTTDTGPELLDLDLAELSIGAGDSGSESWYQYFDGKIGFLWFNTEYIDFSQEANRLKFFDAFGYPVDLGADGSLPTGNQPLIYMNEGFHLGTNLGSGGDFTPVNGPTDGGFVKG